MTASTTKPTQRVAHLVLASAAIACLVFQQSPGNEAVRTAVALDVLKRTSNEFLVGGVVGLLTMIIEGTTSVMIALGLHLDHNFVNRLLTRARKGKDGPQELSTSSRLADFGITLAIGAGLVVVKHHVANPRRTRRQDITTGLAFSLFGSAVSALIGFLAAGGIKYADRVGLGTPAKYFVKYAADWKFWAVVVGSAYLIQGIKKLRKHYRPRGAGTSKSELLHSTHAIEPTGEPPAVT